MPQDHLHNWQLTLSDAFSVFVESINMGMGEDLARWITLRFLAALDGLGMIVIHAWSKL